MIWKQFIEEEQFEHILESEEKDKDLKRSFILTPTGPIDFTFKSINS